jgi:hypothetical protein
MLRGGNAQLSLFEMERRALRLVLIVHKKDGNHGIDNPPNAKVFRRGRPTSKGAWHLLEKSVDNGFTSKSHPEFSQWHGTQTNVAICGIKADTHKQFELYDVTIELSTVGEIDSICPSCYLYHKLPHDHFGIDTMGGAARNHPVPDLSS